ncbi:MAG: glucose-6-phosphate isomerase [Pseudomonadota bacterium]
MSAFDTLRQHRKAQGGTRIADLFAEDPKRFQRFSARLDDMLFDYSKTALDDAARDGLLALARARGVETRRDAMFAGARINETEDRAVLHTALRNLSGGPVVVDGQDVMPGVRDTLARMTAFAKAVRAGTIRAPGGAAFRDVVNIGIGGSDLGPVMAVEALAPYHDGPATHFVSNVDGAHIHDVLKALDPATTLVIVASKTFTTIETMTNARTAERWLRDGGVAPGGHFAALSSATDRTAEFGIDPARVFGFEDWVGGRYSLWGPIGLSLMLAIGPEDFGAFLGGAEAMDRHFATAPLAENLPVLLALVGIWHNNVCGHATRAVLPYDQRLLRLPAYLQQLDMESNGKRVALDGTALTEMSGPIVWGEPGTNGQHAFYQLIHQGTRIVPCEFLVAAEAHEPQLRHQHDLLVSNCFAQAEALMIGRTKAATPHRVFPGDRPSTMLLYRRLDPATLGRIIALYEHRVFVEGAIWGLNSFDQWGVELGKALAQDMLPLVEGGDAASKDGSTAGLLAALRTLRAS